MNNISLLTYTHMNVSDLHDAYFGRLRKYFPNLKNNYVTCNEKINHANCIIYDDSNTYSNQMINALNQIPTKYVIYSQEDYILFDYVQENDLNSLIKTMESDETIPFIRLIHSGIGNVIKEYDENLSYIDYNSTYYFSTQISVWRVEILKEMFEKSKVISIRDEPNNSEFLRKINSNGLFHIKKRNKVGGHYNSYTYPYIATALVRSKWNYSEYSEELNNLFTEYNINPLKRNFI